MYHVFLNIVTTIMDMQSKMALDSFPHISMMVQNQSWPACAPIYQPIGATADAGIAPLPPPPPTHTLTPEAKIKLKNYILTMLPSSPKFKSLLPSSLKIIASAPQLPENKWPFSPAPQNLLEGPIITHAHISLIMLIYCIKTEGLIFFKGHHFVC